MPIIVTTGYLVVAVRQFIEFPLRPMASLDGIAKATTGGIGHHLVL